MQRWLSIVLGMAAVSIAVLLAGQAMSNWRPWRAPTEAGPEASASTDAGVSADGGDYLDLGDADMASSMPLFPTNEPRRDGGVGFRMLDVT